MRSRAKLLQGCLGGALVLVSVVGLAADGGWQAKVDPWVLEHVQEGPVEVLVVLAEQADLGGAAGLGTKLEKGTFVSETLRRVAKQTQGPVLEVLQERGIEHRSYWIVNMIWVRGGLEAVQTMAERGDVAHVYANPAVALDEPVSRSLAGSEAPVVPESPETVEWNIAKVNADDVWALGIDGTGVVVAGQDTGYLWTHPALINQYRGSAGNHDYFWHDAIHSGGGSCGPSSPEPCDDHGHGTHTMGTMVGDDGVGNQVGMAPGAQWIGCRNMNQGVGTPASYAECYQFFIAPTDLAGQSPDPAMAPDVINNSWGCPEDEGCTDPTVLLSVVQAVRAAGIVTVHSAGNEGSSCSSVSTPAGIYAESFSVGATSSSDAIASFSSRGPVTVDGSNRRKPDVSAPGVSIRSSTRDGSYQGGWDGTSMAAPHVAGLVALLISGTPGLAGHVDLVEQVIEQTAVPLTSSQGCGGDGPADVPNNVYGWGRIDALVAASYPLDFRVEPSPASVGVCAPDDAEIDITVSQLLDFDEPVTLSTSGLPIGGTASFSTNPVVPPGTSLLTVGDTASIGPGSFSLDVIGTSSPGSVVHQGTVQLSIFDAVPSTPGLSAPADGATGVALLPTFSWTAATGTVSSLLELATDPAFTQVVATQTVASTSHTLTAALESATTYYWRVTAANPCGSAPVSASSSFVTRTVPPVLLVDDDDNSPDVRAPYEAALQALGLAFDLWDTANSDTEPSAAELAPYRTVVWFTGDEYGGAAGPGPAGESALATWLDAGPACLLISSQEYYYDRGLTAFMQSHLGLAGATSDVTQTTVTGNGSVFAGLGPYVLSYPFSNYSDELVPAATAETAFLATQGAAAVDTAVGASRTAFFGFPFEALPSAIDRETVLDTFLGTCPLILPAVFADGFESGDLNAWSSSLPSAARVAGQKTEETGR